MAKKSSRKTGKRVKAGLKARGRAKVGTKRRKISADVGTRTDARV